ncbi:MAG: RidA family protein [Nitrospinota bacterium]
MAANLDVDSRLKALGIELPDPPSPVGAYVAVRRSGHLLFVSGQIPVAGGKPKFEGKLGSEVSVEEGKEAARLCALNALAQIRKALGGWEGFGGVIRVSGYVASGENFTGQAQVMDGASELFAEVLGERGTHARLAMGVSELPLGVPVELEVIAETST